MPRINQGLTKLKNMTMLVYPKGLEDALYPGQMTPRQIKIRDEHFAARLEAIKVIDTTNYMGVKENILTEDFFKTIDEIGDIATGEAGRTKKGKQSLLKALKTQEAKEAITKLWKDFENIENLGKFNTKIDTIRKYDRVNASQAHIKPMRKILNTLRKLLPCLDKKNVPIYIKTFKTNSFKMLDEMIKRVK